MNEPFVLSSVKDNARLELRWEDPKSDQALVTLESKNLKVSAPISVYLKLNLLSDLFKGLAAHWKGWVGEKSWESLERDFGLRCTSDKTGHITIQVDLALQAPPIWEVSVILMIEAGQLDKIAERFKAFTLQK